MYDSYGTFTHGVLYKLDMLSIHFGSHKRKQRQHFLWS